MQPEQALQQYFGHEHFRSPQREIVESILAGGDNLVIMPTGGGKSLCYQLPALLLDGVTLVVSPLIALMKDQVEALRARDIEAGMINSSQGWPEQRETLDRMRAGDLKLVYVAPERFRADSFLRSLAETRIAMLAIDEAHCISQWGHDFRPDYMRLGKALERIGRPRCAAFTATATPDVRRDIVDQLKLKEPRVFVSGFQRPNLSFNITLLDKKAEKESRLRRLIDTHKTGIIYCATRKSVERVSTGLSQDGVEHVYYHAGLSPQERDTAQDTFMRGKAPVAVATNAFGMGIDRADIRFVCHYELPGSVEAFYQEAGRAGRDGLPAHCELLFMLPDKRVQEFFIEGSNPEPAFIRKVYAFLREHADNSHSLAITQEAIVEEMGERVNPMSVSTAMGILRRERIIDRFDIPGKRVRGTRLLQPDLAPAQVKLPEAALLEKRSRDEAKLDTVIKMCYASGCRQEWILRYFGNDEAHRCGSCDECRRREEVRPLDTEEKRLLQMALSGVARTCDRVGSHEWRPRLGRGKIVLSLIGSQSERVRESRLDQLSTYGILKDEGSTFVNQLFDAMEQAGLLQRSEGEYPLLGLSEKGSRVMLGEEEADLLWPASARDKGGDALPVPPDEALFRKLVDKRNELRKARGNIPAFQIFPNTVLTQLATLKPATKEEAMEIKGIGPDKAQRYLPAFLRVIEAHQREDG